MTSPVNLDNLREMTSGDAALEHELFEVFVSSSEECLAGLTASCGLGAEKVWYTQSHAWKGMSLNLGAEKLGTLCAEAQMNASAGAAEKEKMLAEIKEEYGKVKSFLKEIGLPS
ncbi:MAG: hypothetical protein HGA90_03725 [Alphaproteobacteria bacterium]|nr:hypothetical protein [Alphaproteobacteria bacterium]